MTSDWHRYLRIKRRRPLDKAEEAAMRLARDEEAVRRLGYNRDRPLREVRQAIDRLFSPLLNAIARRMT